MVGAARKILAAQRPTVETLHFTNNTSGGIREEKSPHKPFVRSF